MSKSSEGSTASIKSQNLVALIKLLKPFALTTRLVLGVQVSKEPITCLELFSSGLTARKKLSFVFLFGQVSSGLQELRDEGFFHRDVKPANVFIDAKNSDDESKMNFKIGDFGLVAKIQEDNRVKWTISSS